jgi:hypothetical protein
VALKMSLLFWWLTGWVHRRELKCGKETTPAWLWELPIFIASALQLLYKFIRGNQNDSGRSGARRWSDFTLNFPKLRFVVSVEGHEAEYSRFCSVFVTVSQTAHADSDPFWRYWLGLI